MPRHAHNSNPVNPVNPVQKPLRLRVKNQPRTVACGAKHGANEGGETRRFSKHSVSPHLRFLRDSESNPAPR